MLQNFQSTFTFYAQSKHIFTRESMFEDLMGKTRKPKLSRVTCSRAHS